MKTLPHLKQLTYASIIVAFPFIFSASRDTDIPEPIQPVEKKNTTNEEFIKTPAVKTIQLTVDSLKKSGQNLLNPVD